MLKQKMKNYLKKKIGQNLRSSKMKNYMPITYLKLERESRNKFRTIDILK
jgi:hypothetical protein